MKTAKFLTVLAMASMFVACVEDLAPVENENFQQEMEVVGGEVIGTDVTMNIPVTGVQTKYAGGIAGWDKEDKIGLGWLAQGEDLASDDALYANHMFYVNGDKFEARGNIYKGWHFAYYPYQYMDEIGELELDLNPAQKMNLLNAEGKRDDASYSKRRAQKFHASALQYLTKASLVEPDYNQLQETVVFAPVTPLAEINIITQPAKGSVFATAENMKNYKIESVFINSSVNRFSTKATLIPTKLHQYDDNLKPDENETELKKSFKDAFKSDYSNKLLVDVAEANYTVGGKAVAVAYTLPYYLGKTIDAYRNKIRIEVRTDKGCFTISYDAEAEEGTAQALNNKAIQGLIDALNPEGVLTRPTGVVEGKEETLVLNLYLHEDNFGLDWNVANTQDWTDKITLAADLKSVNPEFVLPELVLVDNAVININEVEIPEGGVTLDGAGKLNVNADWTWDEGIKFATDSEITVEVAANKTLTVNSNLAPKSLVNNGIIDAQAKAVLANLTNNGEVKVAYGTQVYPIVDKEGTISHVVDQLDINNPTRIINLTYVGSEPDVANNKFYANVNTLVVNEGFELDFNKDVTTDPTPGDDDPYQPTPGTPGSTGSVAPYGDDLANINFVINGGSIKSSVCDEAVKNVTMNGGNVGPKITMSALTIEGGENTVTATGINGNVNVKAGEGTITVAESITGSVTINGNYDVNAKSIGGDVNVKAGEGTITVFEGITGNVTVNGNYDVNAKSIGGDVNVTGEGTITVAEGITGNVTINGNYNVNAKSIGKAVDVTGKGTISVTENIAGTFEAEGNYTVNAAKIEGNVIAKGQNSFLNVKEFGGNLHLIQTADASTLNGNVVAGDVTLEGAFDVHNVTAKNMKISRAVKLVEKCTISGDMHNTTKNDVVVTDTKISGKFLNEGKATLQNTTVEGLLTNNSEVVISGESTVGSIVNNGKLTSSIDLHVTDVTLNEGSTTILSSNGTKWDRTIWYTGNYVFDQMTLMGTVVQVNAAQFTADVNAAIAAAAAGTPQTVELKGDVTLTQPLTFTAPLTKSAGADKTEITIDLNGFTIKNETASTDSRGNLLSSVIYVENSNIVLTLKGEGTIESAGEASFTIPVWVREGVVNIEGGKYISHPDKDGNASHAVYAMNDSKVYISGGVFEARGKASDMKNANPINCQDHKDARFYLSGGKFLKFGAKEAAETGVNEIELVEGYMWTTEADSEGYYSVVAE